MVHTHPPELLAVPVISLSAVANELAQPDGSMSARAPDELPEQLRVRRAKRDRMLDAGIDPYPVEVDRTHTLREVRDAHPDLPPDTATGEQVSVAGRVIFLRNTGKLCFATLREGDGTELQVMLSRDKVGEEQLTAWKSDVDLGDHVFVRGEVITSRRGELSVLAEEWRMAAKALRPLPVAHKELAEETPGPTALRRPHRAGFGAQNRPHQSGRRAVAPRRAAFPRLRRGRNAHAAVGAWRGGRPTVRHPLQRPGHRPLPPDRSRALPQALRGGRYRASLRDQPQLP